MKRVVNLFAGPGVGKSTLAAELFVYMKQQHLNVELVSEYAKDLTWENRHNVLTQDQLYVFAKQHRKLFRLREHVDFAICESPLLFSSIYYDPEYTIYNYEIFNQLVLDTFQMYPNINILLQRNENFTYQETGRNQTLTEAKQLDQKIYQYLKLNNIQFELLPVSLNLDLVKMIFNLL